MRARMLALPVSLVLAAVPVAATTDPITLCQHVSITGAAPMPRHPDRFGQFYFDYVNTELGGVNGRPVRFLAFDDQGYPAGARAALERCARENPLVVLGRGTRDENISGAKWSALKGIPYLQTTASEEHLLPSPSVASLAPSDERQMRGLARLIVERAPGVAGDRVPRVGMVRIDSPFYEPGHDAFVAALTDAGIELEVDEVVQKDEQQFSSVWFDLLTAGVDIVNVFAPGATLVRMLGQRPTPYEPVITSISADLIHEQVAGAARGVRLLAFGEPAPLYEPFGPPVEWQSEIDEFERIFDLYSPEQVPRRDALDWQNYLRAKQLYRMLLSLSEISREAVAGSFQTHRETASQSYPGCALDFVDAARVGGRAWHLFEATDGAWRQIALCMSPTTIPDVDPTITIECGEQAQIVTSTFRCLVHAPKGLSLVTVRDDGIPPGSAVATFEVPCVQEHIVETQLVAGVRRVSVTARDCAGGTTSSSYVALAA